MSGAAVPYLVAALAGARRCATSTPRRETWLRYVVHRDVARFAAAGWLVADTFAGIHHGAYAVLMEWGHEGEPPA